MNPQPVALTVDNQTIRGKFYQPIGVPKKLAVLFLHGWTGKPNEAAAEVLAEQGYYAMTISYRGHNNSDGELKDISAKKSLDDSLAAYDYFVSHLPDDLQIVVVGNSYGGYMASLLAAERKVAALSLRVPAAYADGGFEEPRLGKGSENPEVMKWRLTPHKYTDNIGLTNIHNFAGPIQILEAENDDVVPHQTVQNYVDAVADKNNLDYQLLKGWPHSMGTDPARNREFQTILLDWLNSL